MTDFEAHLTRQIAFSRATFGPGTRQQGVIDHIKKELDEVANAKDSAERIEEWTDVAILALDGLWREIAYGLSDKVSSGDAAYFTVLSVLQKQARNELRNWPDWRTADPDKAIEHIREV